MRRCFHFAQISLCIFYSCSRSCSWPPERHLRAYADVHICVSSRLKANSFNTVDGQNIRWVSCVLITFSSHWSNRTRYIFTKYSPNISPRDGQSTLKVAFALEIENSDGNSSVWNFWWEYSLTPLHLLPVNVIIIFLIEIVFYKFQLMWFSVQLQYWMKDINFQLIY